jgi:hypothetical protein
MKNTIKLNINYDLNKIVELHNDLKKTTKKSNSKNLNKFTQKEVEQILDSITEKLTITDNSITLILVAGVLQIGGSNQKSGNAVSYNLGEYSLSSQQLNNFIKKVVKNGTNRQLARTIADEIAEIALAINIPGDLHTQMLLEYPNLSDTEKTWCSNFQTQNPNCPKNVRKWLVENFRSRFNR